MCEKYVLTSKVALVFIIQKLISFQKAYTSNKLQSLIYMLAFPLISPTHVIQQTRLKCSGQVFLCHSY